jgi:hypothetical protein
MDKSSKGWGGSLLQIDLEIVWMMRRKLTSLSLIEDIRKLMII